MSMRMNTLKKLTTAAAFVAVMSWANVAQGATINAISAEWSNMIGGSNQSLNVTNGTFLDARWGVATPNSGLGVEAVATPVGVPVNANFVLTTLRHYNNPILAISAADSVDLTVDVDFDLGVPATVSFAYRFFVDETFNGGTCAFPSVDPCSDEITFENLSGDGQFVTIDGVNYTLQLVGFSNNSDGTDLTEAFISQEGGESNAYLVARLVPVSDVPEPGTMALLGLGLLGLAAKLRRRVS